MYVLIIMIASLFLVEPPLAVQTIERFLQAIPESFDRGNLAISREIIW